MSLFSALQVSASGMEAQRTRAELLVENMANSETTRTRQGGPYRRKDVVFSSEEQASPFSAVFQSEMGEGVTVSDVIQDNRPPEMRYMPGHPDADANGYVAFPNLNPAEEMVDLLSAQRSYEGNVSAIAAVKDMINHSIEIMS
ncbi:MAG TPA: flagellar basal body rod protein FlgC [Bryobacteraceae bacterium]|nr:flagellar basal body rod protein FlgC [Bryobacteraceae bacterium]